MLLSIIIPVYNCETYLEHGFEKLSKLYDTSLDFEIIYINDGSTDNSLTVLNEIEAKNHNVTIISQENKGSSEARNTGIKIAQGAYIQFLDADDYLNLETIIEALTICKTQNLDAINYRMINVNAQGEKIGELPKHPVTYNKVISGIDALIQGYVASSICCFLWRTKVLLENQLLLYPKITHMDVEFTLRALPYFKKLYFLDRVGYYYLQRAGSITKPKTQQQRESYYYDEVIIAGLVKNNCNKDYPEALNNVYKTWSNSIVWGLIFGFIKHKKLTSKQFKTTALSDLKNNNLYPIKGALQTNFQYLTKHFFNLEWLLKIFLKL